MHQPRPPAEVLYAAAFLITTLPATAGLALALALTPAMWLIRAIARFHQSTRRKEPP